MGSTRLEHPGKKPKPLKKLALPSPKITTVVHYAKTINSASKINLIDALAKVQPEISIDDLHLKVGPSYGYSSHGDSFRTITVEIISETKQDMAKYDAAKAAHARKLAKYAKDMLVYNEKLSAYEAQQEELGFDKWLYLRSTTLEKMKEIEANV